MSRRLTVLKSVLWTLVGVLAAVSVVRFIHGLGAVTNLSDAAPWGLWIGFDVMSGVALAAGGFVLAGIVYIFGLESYRPFVRAAILTALLGYVAVAVGLLYDLGLPWRIWHPVIHWQYHSVLFEVAACVILYLTVLTLEFLPVVLEHRIFSHPIFKAILKALKRVSIFLIIAGIILSTLHQSSLGSLFLITPYRLHPLWYSPIIYVQFFVSAVALGLMTVVLESLFSNYFLGHTLHRRELGGLGLAASVVLWVYVALRLGDLAVRGALGTGLDGSWQSWLFVFELGVSAVIPATLMLFKPIRSQIAGVGTAAVLVVSGMVLHRLDVSIVAFARPEGVWYFPSWEEFAVSIGIVAGGILIFLFFVEHLNVFDDVKGHSAPEEPSYDPATLHPLLPKRLALPRVYSLAFLGGAAVAFPFLPLGGVEHVPVPVGGPRSVTVEIQDRGEDVPRHFALAVASGASTRVLMIDGNRDGDLVLFDHDDHAERLNGDDSCETCHHLTKPFDENTSCSECHRDMYDERSVFDHDIHVIRLGGNEGCVECHSDGATVKSYETITECSECHRGEVAAQAFVEAPPERWGPAVGYMDAMHALCVDCHLREVLAHPGQHPENLNRCTTCHDVDWREDMRRMAPRRRLEIVSSSAVEMRMPEQREVVADEIQNWIRSHLFDQVPIAISIIDRDYRIVDANPHFEELYGAWEDRPCYEVYKGRDEPCLQCAAMKTFDDGVVRVREEKGMVGNGDQMDYLVQMVPVRGPLGVIRFIVEMSTDISPVKRLEHEKREAERLAAVGETVAGIAHGIKNVLMGLEGGMYAVNSGIELGDDARIARGWTVLEENIGRISQFVKEFLGFAKGRETSTALVDPNLPAQEVAALFREGAAQAGVRLDVNLQADLKPLPLDADGIHTCLANLVSNAINACLVSETRRAFVVTLASRFKDDTLVYEVADNGGGMDYEISRKVFSKFFTTKGSDRGTGLGLLTTKRIVNQHGGRTSFTSKEGEGSVFRIELPRDRLPQPKQAPEASDEGDEGNDSIG